MRDKRHIKMRQTPERGCAVISEKEEQAETTRQKAVDHMPMTSSVKRKIFHNTMKKREVEARETE